MPEKLKIAVKSDVGMVRTENQDHFFVWEPTDLKVAQAKGALVVVADGMGGHLGGTVASHTAVDAMVAAFQKSTLASLHDLVEEAIVAANQAVRDKQQADPKIHDCGTTCVCLVVRGNLAVVGHLGDSRCYLFRGNTIERVTRDHTYLNELIDIGLLTAEQAKGHPDRNIITRCVGMSSTLSIDFNRRELQMGDVLLLCSDGLTNFVTDEEMSQISIENDPSTACERLVELANKRGGEDNITVAIARVTGQLDVDPKQAALDLEEHFQPSATPLMNTVPMTGADDADTPRTGSPVTPVDRTREMRSASGPQSALTTAQSIAGLMGDAALSTTLKGQGGAVRGEGVSVWVWVIGIEILLLLVLILYFARF